MYLSDEELPFEPGVTACIDRLVFVAKLRVPMEEFHSFMIRRDSLVQYGSAKYPYAYFYKLLGNIYVSVTGADKKSGLLPFRIDFNPAKLNNMEIDEVYTIIAKAIYPRITRLDIAIDYRGYDLSTVEWVEDRARSRVAHHGGNGKLQTLYLGAWSSNNFIRIYDKAKEQKLDGTWWRVEAEIRIDKETKPFAKNPFAGIHGRVGPMGNTDIDLRDMALIEFVRNHPEMMGCLEKRKRSALKKMMIAAPGDARLSPEPAEIYEKNLARLQLEVGQWLAGCKLTTSRRAEALTNYNLSPRGEQYAVLETIFRSID